MTSTPPTERPPSPPAPPAYTTPLPVREGRPVSFYVAIFLTLLLLASVAVNLLLLVVSMFGSAAGFGGTSVASEDGALYEMVFVGGDREAEEIILRIPIEGAIVEASSPVIGAAGGSVSQVKRALRAAARDPAVKGILVDINSPGGGVADSDEIYRLLREFRSEHTGIDVVALMGEMATSGGYYIAAACESILARPTTITGSIGVIINSFNVSEAMEKLGIEAVTIVSKDTPYKDMLSPLHPISEAEVEKVRAIVQEMYERFVTVVDDGRPKLGLDDVRRLATGEIYSAGQAVELGLVDEIMSLDEAVERMCKGLGIESARVVEQRRIRSLLESMLQVRQSRISVDDAVVQLLRGSTGPKFLYYWLGGR